MSKALLHIRQHARWYALLLLVFVSIALWSVILHEERDGILTVTFLNVGKGNAVFIESPSGAQVLVDAGPDKNIMKEISAVLPWYDRSIDLLVMTNTDAGNYTGFIPLLQNYSVGEVLESGMNTDTAPYQVLKSEIAAKKIPKIIAQRGQTLDLGGGATLEILFPERDISNFTSDSGTIVMRLSYGDTSVLLTGDSPTSILNYVATLTDVSLKSTILALGYHGALATSSQNFLQNVAPQETIIFADPTKPTVAQRETENILNVSHVPFLNRANSGNITFHSDGKKFILQK